MLPRQQCLPIWVKKKDTAEKLRPIANSLAIAVHVSRHLWAALSLRLIGSFKNVFMCSDRTFEERKARKGIVTNCKSNFWIIHDPNRKHYIGGGKVITFSADRTHPFIVWCVYLYTCGESEKYHKKLPSLPLMMMHCLLGMTFFSMISLYILVILVIWVIPSSHRLV